MLRKRHDRRRPTWDGEPCTFTFTQTGTTTAAETGTGTKTGGGRTEERGAFGQAPPPRRGRDSSTTARTSPRSRPDRPASLRPARRRRSLRESRRAWITLRRGEGYRTR